MAKKHNPIEELQVNCGKTTDSFDDLKKLCNKKAEELLKTMEFHGQDTISVSFWTENFPELICVGKFYKDEGGTICYELDFSESTL